MRVFSELWKLAGPGTNEFNFGDDTDHRPDPGVRSPKSGFSGLSIMLACGGGLRFLITSSYSSIYLGQFQTKQQAQLLLGDRATRKHAKDC